jgi:N6-L-threonylcarbamoyladenine synthase/protein kinase Bud32
MEGVRIGKGAEADLYLRGDRVSKIRIRKAYREPHLDRHLRRTRTRREARLLSLARRAGVATPYVRDVDNVSYTVEMMHVPGEQVRRLLPRLSREERRRLCVRIGEAVGRLHSANIVHGDLTTANMLLHEGRVYFIDFGLGAVSDAVEDKGVDLLVFKKVLHSTHYRYEGECWKGFVEGYTRAYKKSAEALERLRIIARRGRYFPERA